MSVKTAIEQRRAYRALVPIVVDKSLIEDLALCAGLAPSCFNKQPWRFVFCYESTVLQELYTTLAPGNEWARQSNLIVAVVSNRESDCIIGSREYFLFDTGLATAFLILRATELNLIAHPIAGFDEEKVKSILAVPASYRVITLIIIGQKANAATASLSERQLASEKERPPRLSLDQFAFFNHFQHP